LSSNLAFNTNVRAIRLPQPNSVPSGSSIVAGWGHTSTGLFPNSPNQLQKAIIPLIDVETCRNAMNNFGEADQISHNNICTGPLTGGLSVCGDGDRGSPLFQV